MVLEPASHKCPWSKLKSGIVLYVSGIIRHVRRTSRRVCLNGFVCASVQFVAAIPQVQHTLHMFLITVDTYFVMAGFHLVFPISILFPAFPVCFRYGQCRYFILDFVFLPFHVVFLFWGSFFSRARSFSPM